MALVTSVKFIITWVFASAIFILFGPIVYYMRYDSGLWNLMPSDMLAWGDTLYLIWIANIIIVPGIIIVSAIREAERRAASSR